MRLGEWLIENLSDQKWTEFRAAVAFAKTSGVNYLAEPLSRFAARGRVKLSVGIDAFGTSFEALQVLLQCMGSSGELWVFHNEANHLFHPKAYIFRNQAEARVVIGSNNLTRGGLFTNYELAVELALDLSLDGDRALFRELEELLDGYCTEKEGTARRLDPQELDGLLADRYILNEADIAPAQAPQPVRGKSRFKSSPIPPPPILRRKPGRKAAPVAPLPSPGYRGFVMTLQQGDVGYGQVTPGTSRRSPEIFLPVAVVRDAAPDFWGWDHLFVPDPQKPERKRRIVSVRVGGKVIDAAIWRNPKKDDFRLLSEAIRRVSKVGDILHVEKAPPGSAYDYHVESISPEDERYSRFLALCANPVRNSPKRWGYYL